MSIAFGFPVWDVDVHRHRAGADRVLKLIFGLGNPGRDYESTRHNAGFMALRRLAERWGLTGTAKGRFHAQVLEGVVAGQPCQLIAPMTFMNRSGLSVGEAVRFFKADVPDVIVLVDDVALPLGKVRLRGKGSAGGHNGLKDVQRVLGSIDYPRLRIGIGSPVGASQHEHVLGRFSKAEFEALEPGLDAAAQAVELWLREGIERAMTRVN